MIERPVPLPTLAALLVLAAFAAFALSNGGNSPDPATAGDDLQPIWGDIDCGGSVDSVDALKGLRFVVGLAAEQEDGCPQIAVDSDDGNLWGDWDCSGGVDSVDSLQLLRQLLALPVSQSEGCPVIGGLIGPPVTIESFTIEPGWKDYGDAPGGTETGYSAGVATGAFPTDPSDGGPSHPFPFSVWLGEFATVEEEPFDGTDADDGLLTVELNSCADSSALIVVNPSGLSETELEGGAFLNVFADWNRDGKWEDDDGCAPEWAVVNEPVDLTEGGGGLVVLGQEFKGGNEVDEFWMRVTVTREEYDPGTGGEHEGETEDYLISEGGVQVSGAVPAGPAPIRPLAGEHFFCRGGMINHGEPAGRGFLELRFEQTKASQQTGLKIKGTSVKFGPALGKEGEKAPGVTVTNVFGGYSGEEDGRFVMFGGADITTVKDEPDRIEGPFRIPIVIEIDAEQGKFRTGVVCGFFVDHAEGGRSLDVELDGFRGGPGRSGAEPGVPNPKFIVVSHGDRVVLETDAIVPEGEAAGSSYDPDSLMVFDENGVKIDNSSLEAVGIQGLVIPAKGREIFFDTIRDDRVVKVQTVIIRLSGMGAGGIEFTDYFRVVITHDEDTTTRALIKKLLEDGLVRHFDEDESFRVAYTSDRNAIRSMIPPTIGAIWHEETECEVGPGGTVRDLMFGSVAYIIDYDEGASDIFLKADADELAQPSGDEDSDGDGIIDDEDCYPYDPNNIPPGPPFPDVAAPLTNNGPGGPNSYERGNFCGGVYTAAELNLPGLSIRLVEAGIDEVILSVGAPVPGPSIATAPNGTNFVTPIPGGESHRYPNCYPRDNPIGIVASTPGTGNSSVLAYVPFCNGTCPAGSQDGFVILIPAGPNDHFVRAAVSPDLRQIAFEYDVRDEIGQLLNAQIYVGGFDPSIPAISNALPVTSVGFNFSPTWSADSQQIAYASFQEGQFDIWVMDADGGKQVNLTGTPDIDEEHPSWQNP